MLYAAFERAVRTTLREDFRIVECAEAVFAQRSAA
jgi:hypothetical protein